MLSAALGVASFKRLFLGSFGCLAPISPTDLVHVDHACSSFELRPRGNVGRMDRVIWSRYSQTFHSSLLSFLGLFTF